MAKLISPNHGRYDVTGKPGQEFLEKIDIFYDSNMLIDVCTSFLGLSSSASQLGMVKHIKFDHILDTIFCWFWTESVQCAILSGARALPESAAPVLTYLIFSCTVSFFIH